MKFLKIIIFSCLLCSRVIGADWPTHGHDNRRSATTEEQLNISSLSLSWSWKSPTPPSPAWKGTARWDAYNYIRNNKSMRAYDRAFNISSAGNQLFVASSAESAVIALNTADGIENWRAFASAPVRIAPTYDSGKVYFGSDDGTVRCVSAEDGAKIWSYRANPSRKLIPNDGRFISLYPCRTGVMVKDGKAYAGFGLVPWKASYLSSIDANSGKQLYRTTLNVGNSLGHTLEGALLATNDRIFAPQGRISPVSFNLSNGVRQARLEGGGGAFAIVTNDGKLLTGPGFGNSSFAKSRKNFIQETNTSNLSAIVRHADAHAVLATATTFHFLIKDKIRAVTRNGGATRWLGSLEGANTLALAGTTLFVGGRNRVIALDPANGEELWTAVVSGEVHSLAIANGKLFASTSGGRIYCYQ
ncbi:MAG: PQQ-binding-like beta-propeller repeat protein [Verrucomicrobiaceae bacterium]|nr:PQQ-binding-like beta-propeller repeat protein [Verrucomicrobiaceae bacterium]